MFRLAVLLLASCAVLGAAQTNECSRSVCILSPLKLCITFKFILNFSLYRANLEDSKSSLLPPYLTTLLQTR